MNDLTRLDSTVKSLGLTADYGRMLGIIQESESAVALAAAQHGKSHSQFQYANLDCSGPVAGPTKIRNWRHVLAVIQQTRDALNEAAFSLRECRARAELFSAKAMEVAEQDSPQAELLELLRIKSDQQKSRAAAIERNMAGAIRKLATYTLQFQELERQIRQELAKSESEPITEEDFERDEARFHVMKAFQQALQAARAHGRIDHGNLIYLDDLGISGRLATEDVGLYLKREHEYCLAHPDHVAEVHAMQRAWLADMAAKYANCPHRSAEAKGLIPGVLSEAVLALSCEGGEP